MDGMARGALLDELSFLSFFVQPPRHVGMITLASLFSPHAPATREVLPVPSSHLKK